MRLCVFLSGIFGVDQQPSGTADGPVSSSMSPCASAASTCCVLGLPEQSSNRLTLTHPKAKPQQLPSQRNTHTAQYSQAGITLNSLKNLILTLNRNKCGRLLAESSYTTYYSRLHGKMRM